jgi:lambda family phage portal protein
LSAIRAKALQRSARSVSRRARAQAALRLFGSGGYNGARTDRPALKNWTPRIGGPNSDTIPDLEPLRARGADLERNAPIAAGVINTNVTSTVGTGLVPHSRIDREFLGLTDDQADAWESDAERIFAWWAESTACDLSRRMDFYGMQALALRSCLSRGDLFGVRRFVDRPGDLLSTRIQMIEADRVSNPIGKPETDRFMGGVETDENGVQVRVHVRSAHPGEISSAAAFTWTAEEVYGASTGQRRVLHVMDVLRIDQQRGVPYLAPVMEALKQLDRYTEAEIMAAVVNSFLSVFIETNTLDDEGPLTDMGDPATLDAARALPGSQNDIRLGSGAVFALNPGEKISQTSVSRPNPQFDPFVLAILRQVGVALEVPYELLVKHFTASYSASRAAMIEAWRSTMRRRGWLTSTFCRPIWSWVIEEAVARGLLEAPGFFDNPLVRQAYCTAEWMGPAMGSLDPESDVAAAKARVDLGVSTLAEETSQLTGGDWEQKHRQRVKEQRMRERDGLTGETVGERIITEPTAPIEPTTGDPAEPAPGSGQQPPVARVSRTRRLRAARLQRREPEEVVNG